MKREQTQAELMEKARSAALRLLTARPRTRADLTTRLEKKGFEPDVVAGVLDALERVGLVDDRAYAAAMVRSELVRKPAGRRLLEMKLRQRGVPAAEAGEEIARGLAGVDGPAECERLLRARAQTFPAGLEPAAAMRRLVGLASRRGFESDVAMTAARTVLRDLAAVDAHEE